MLMSLVWMGVRGAICVAVSNAVFFLIYRGLPEFQDARRMGAPEELTACIRERAARGERPPWGSFLGGEIYIHGGGAETDWTAGCIALNDADAQTLYDAVPLGTIIEIDPGGFYRG